MEIINFYRFCSLSAVAFGIGSVLFFANYVIQGNLGVDYSSASEALPFIYERIQSGDPPVTMVLSFTLPVLAGVSGLGLFHYTRELGSLSTIAAVTFIGGSFLVIHRALIGVGLNSLAFSYETASVQTRESVTAVFDMLMALWESGNTLGGVLVGIGTLLYSLLLLRTPRVARWLCWLGIVTALLSGLFALLIPISEVFGAIVRISQFSIFPIWVFAIGVMLWHAPEQGSMNNLD